MNTEELANQARIVKRNRSVPYDAIERAVTLGREAFPDADDVTPGLYDGSPYITVWRAGRGRVHIVDVS